MELRVWLGASILHIDQPHTHRKIHIGHQKLLLEYLETDSLLISEADDGTVKLQKAHDLHRELPVSQLIEPKNWSQLWTEISYLISQTYTLECRLVNPMSLDESLIHKPPISGSMLGIPKSRNHRLRRLPGLLLFLGFYMWTTGSSLLIHDL